MDSRLLNPLHDDPFDGNFWSTSNESFGLQQLSETLHGILPIAATDVAADIYNSAIGLTDDLRLEHKNDDSSTSPFVYEENDIIYDDFAEEPLRNHSNGIEIATLNSSGAVYASDEELKQMPLTDYQDDRSVCSDSTFRTRTDSSSIADYESHTSDYDDDDDEDSEATEDMSAEADSDAYFETDILPSDDSLLDLVRDGCTKRRTISTNTIGSDVDGLGLAIDASTFDLADFITKDDIVVKTPTKVVPAPAVTETVPAAQAKVTAKVKKSNTSVGKKKSEADSDTDVIVDVETFEDDQEEDEEVPFVDNVKSDPSWSPKHLKTESNTREKQATGEAQPVPKQNSLKPAKKLKGKLGAVRAKPQSMQRSIKMLAAVKQVVERKDVIDAENKKPAVAVVALVTGSPTNKPTSTQTLPLSNGSPKAPIKPKRKLNLEEYKQRHAMTTMANLPVLPLKKQTVAPINSNNGVLSVPTCKTPPKPHSEAVVSVVKSLKAQLAKPMSDPITEARNKVLRMQELKRAQQLRIIDSTISAKVPRVTKLPPLKDMMRDTNYSAAAEETQPCSADYEEIVIVSASCNTDISIPPLNALLHLRCLDGSTQQRVTTASRSLLKSSVLLQKVQANDRVQLSHNSLIASIQKVVVQQALPRAQPIATTTADARAEHGEDRTIMHLRKDRMRKSTATIGIQTDLLPDFPIFPAPLSRRRHYRKRHKMHKSSGDSAIAGGFSSDSDSENEDTRHTGTTELGDTCSSSSERLRHAVAVGTTGASADMAAGGYSSRSSRRHRSSISSSYSESERRLRRQRRQRRTSYKQRAKKYARSKISSSSSSSWSSDTQSDHEKSGRGRTRSRSPHCRVRERSESRADGTMRWQSQSSLYSNNNSRNYMDRNVSQPAVEERRIVYVGRIESDTSKELLRQKFSAYGPINQITLHYKDTGMKYGFVTFERSQDAFAAIDSSARDSKINMYDVSFGGRRAFCRATYADLDNAGINTYHSYIFPTAAPPPKEDDSFEALLRQVKARLGASKPTPATTAATVPPLSQNNNSAQKSQHVVAGNPLPQPERTKA